MGWLDAINNIRRKVVEDNNQKEILFDTGRRVRLGKQIAEGGFSFVYDAKDLSASSQQQQQGRKFVVKQIRCEDDERLQSCHQEAQVHLSFNERDHPNLMPLLGFNVVREPETTIVCYMLFPKMVRSLREEVNCRLFDDEMQQIQRQHRLPPIMPWENELVTLEIFHGVVRGVYHLHQNHYSHRDVKLENVLFDTPQNVVIPKLTDFGSCGKVLEPVPDQKRLNTLIDQAATHTTMSIRPPELFSGGIFIANHKTTNSFQNDDAIIDYSKVDVWSLGCLLFGILFGASPFECEFDSTNGQIHIVECSQTRILSEIPQPPPSSVVKDWYSNDTMRLIRSLLLTDRTQRPCMEQLVAQLENIIPRLGGRVLQPIPIDREKLNQFEKMQQQLTPGSDDDQSHHHHHALHNSGDNFDFNASFCGLVQSSTTTTPPVETTTSSPQPMYDQEQQTNAMAQAAEEQQRQQHEKQQQEEETGNGDHNAIFQDSFSSFQGA